MSILNKTKKFCLAGSVKLGCCTSGRYVKTVLTF